MARNAKYIIWDDGLNECVMIFSNHLNHAQVAFSMGIEPISAGFVEFQSNPPDPTIKAVVSGESVSLKLKSRPEDSAIIQRDFRLNWSPK